MSSPAKDIAAAGSADAPANDTTVAETPAEEPGLLASSGWNRKTIGGFTAILFIAWCFSDSIKPAKLEKDLIGKIAVVTGGSKGSGLGFAQGLCESGATVYITGRKLGLLEEACQNMPAPGKCIPKVVSNSSDEALEELFTQLSAETGGRSGRPGRIDILVNNAYGGIDLWAKQKLIGKPFWEQGMALFDTVFTVGLRSHYKTTMLALPLLKNSKGRGLVVNVNSVGSVMYFLNVAYGMGQCALDKMSSGMAQELKGTNVDIYSWWGQELMQTDNIKKGSMDVDGVGWRAKTGILSRLELLLPSADGLFHSALAGTLLAEGRVLSAFARDKTRNALSGRAVQTGQLASKYNVRDERGIRSPMYSSWKFLIFMWSPLRSLITLENPAGAGSEPTASKLQLFIFGTLPDVHIPQWFLKLTHGNPLTELSVTGWF